MKSSRTILTVLVFLMVVVVALAFSPKAMADTVLSESADDWSFVLQPNASGDMMRFNFYGRLKPAYKYKDIKDWNGSGAANTDFTMPEFITYFGEEKVVVILPSPAFPIPPITVPVICSVIPSSDVETKGELLRCVMYTYTTTGGQDLEILKADMAASGENLFFLAAENWGEEPLLMAVTSLIGNSGDSDSDLVPNSVDNCADVKNYSQEDSDLDGVGDACVLAAAEEEPAELDDEDYDGVMDESDLCAGTADGAAVDENGCSEAQLAASDTLPVDDVLGPTAASDEGFCSLVETSAGTGPLPFALILMFLAIRRRKS